MSLGGNVSAGNASHIRLFDDGAAKTSTTTNSYGFGVDGSGHFKMSAGATGRLQFLTGNTVRLSIEPGGEVSAGKFSVTQASPAATDACVAGQIVGDASYLYICASSGAWKRVAVTGGY